MDDSLSYIIGIWSFTSDYIVYWMLLMIRQRPGKGMSIHLDGFGLSESNETVYFQFRALTDVIKLIMPF